jgi:omega-6 fatty acid desaturase (delta-12 desaturase)
VNANVSVATRAIGNPSGQRPAWHKAIAKYQRASLGKAIWQLVNTFIPYALLLYLMAYTIQQGYTYWITLAIAVPAAGLLVRIFIIFHDCTHQSFFTSRRANILLGYITGILTFTDYAEWRHTHLIHHGTAGNLDRRGVGDVWTMTTREYRTAPKRIQLAYRLLRHPLVMFGLGPAFMFLIAHRIPGKQARKAERISVYVTDIIILAIVVIMSLTIGLKTYLLIQLPIIIIAATLGLWLFYVQHQFETVYWSHNENWNPLKAALEGSSYYKLPGVLQWFTGNIGLHHVHHARARIPNYNLQQCYDETPALQAVEPLTIGKSLKSLWFNLWDEEQRKMVGFKSLKES